MSVSETDSDMVDDPQDSDIESDRRPVAVIPLIAAGIVVVFVTQATYTWLISVQSFGVTFVGVIVVTLILTALFAKSGYVYQDEHDSDELSF